MQGLSDAAFQAIMHTLLGYVKRDKFIDHLSERLAARLGTVAEVRTGSSVAARLDFIDARAHLPGAGGSLLVVQHESRQS